MNVGNAFRFDVYPTDVQKKNACGMLAVACTKGFVNSTENGKIFFRLPRKNHQNGEWQAVAGPVGGSGSQWCWGKQAKKHDFTCLGTRKENSLREKTKKMI